MTEPDVSIGIMTEKDIRFELYGEFTVEKVERKFSGRFKAQTENDKITIYHEKKAILSLEEITFSPFEFETESFLLKDVVIGKNFHWERKENQRFRGKLKFIIENKLLTAVNILTLEEYLTSVISSEMSANSSLELLKAHSIVSRGWLLAQLHKKNKRAVSEVVTEDEIIRWYDREDHTLYDFCADDHCQRYQGVTKIVNDNALNAINATTGLALVFNNVVCDTRYSKCCGGVTEAFENVWEPEEHPYMNPIVDYKFSFDDSHFDLRNEKHSENWIRTNPQAFCNTTDERILSSVLVNFDFSTKDFFRWKVEYTQQEISELIKNRSGIDYGDIIDLVPVERGSSGRIIKLKIHGTKKILTIGKELEIRKTLSKSHLYSSAFVVHKEQIENNIPQKFILLGSGWGHGVGLCQIGAAVMGELGYSFDEILTHYFKNATIQKIY